MVKFQLRFQSEYKAEFIHPVEREGLLSPVAASLCPLGGAGSMRRQNSHLHSFLKTMALKVWIKSERG